MTNEKELVAKTKKTIDTAKKKTTSSVKKSETKKKIVKTIAKKKTAVKKPTKKKTKKFSAYEGKTLVVVESPAKAKTLEKILGSKYRVLASIGHVRDLPKARLAIDVEHDFEPEYIKVRGKAELIRTLKGASDASQETLLASDPDREGEAIAWHLATLLEIDPKSKCRIKMHEITKSGVASAVVNPEEVDMDKVNAQQARRILDRLVGYQLSPLLWYKVQRGLSAGRVQSVALRIICEREDEIDKFIPEEYWLIDVDAESIDSAKRKYTLRLDKYKDKPLKITNVDQAKKIEQTIKSNQLTVDKFTAKKTAKSALPPFKTSTLQQEASRRCGFAPKRTMRIAQSLYEGVEIPGRGPTGLITYMRTDSLRIAPEAITSSRKYIEEVLGKNYLPSKPNEHTLKSKSQEGHEAIRATDPFITPDSIKGNLSPEQYKLYQLIWSRFVASQTADAKISRSTLICNSGDYSLKQSGIVVTFDGWGCLYPLGVKDTIIKPAIDGEKLKINNLVKEQKYTRPPARYLEAGLVKVLEEKGIGRPSTYAVIIDTLSTRRYVERGEEDRRLIPTKLGRIVNKFLVKHFSNLINENFTANMEEEFDKIESGTNQWRDVISTFWSGFKPNLDDVTKNAENMHPEPEYIGEKCPECNNDLILKHGRFGEFIACTGYPECKYTRKIVRTTGVKCPKCGEGELIRRKASKGKVKGRFFYGCSKYPDCDYIAWKNPKLQADQNISENLAEKENLETDI
ncbi:MAG: type I DNA topoisomerase [Synergistaceae bacterium]|nr:type I DNA topoisomerase [Synergistaceae bacterium]